MSGSAVILVVDDVPQNVRLLQAVLEPHGHTVLTAGSGEEALARLAEGPVDLVLLDVVMPGIDGYDVCRRLRADASTSFLPVVMVTASGDRRSGGDRGRRRRAIEAGVAELQNSNARERLTSDALCKVADLVDESRRPDFYMRAIDLAAGNPRPWHLLAGLGRQTKLTPEQSASVRAALEKFAVKRYPDFAFNVIQCAMSRPRHRSAAQAARRNAPVVFGPSRPARENPTGGRGPVPQGKPARPRDGRIRRCAGPLSNIGPVVLEAIAHVDDLLSEMQQIQRLIAVYRIVWQCMPQPEASIAVQGTPFYRVCARYRDLLTEMGQAGSAQLVQTRWILTSTVPSIKR